MTETKPVDLGTLVHERLDELRRSTDGVAVETEIHPESYVRANDLLPSVVDNLLRNAVEHGSTNSRPKADDALEHGSTSNRPPSDGTLAHDGGESWLRVTVLPVERRGGRNAVQFRVEDDGPGFTEAELAVHATTGTTETALQHSDGIGLWLVRWIVDAYEGEFEVANADDGGAVVTVTLPATDGGS